MRRRITRTMVAVVAAALLVATVGTAVVLRYGVRADTRRDLGRQAADLAARLEDIQRPQVVNAVSVALRLEDLRILCFGTPCPRFTGVPPPGLRGGDLDPARLAAGETVTGTRGSLVYAAAGARQGGSLLVVVLTRRVDASLPGGLWFVAVAGVTLAVAAGVAGDLARRLTRPLGEAQAATRRIAAGDLATRLPVTAEEGEELAGLAQSINTMAASLERSRGLERQFLLSVSHDLRTPLTSIRGFAEALAEGQHPDPAHAAAVILSESRRLERLVHDLLELARLGARRFSLDVRAVDGREVVADAAEGFRPAAEKEGVALAVHAGGDAPVPVAADPDRLAQIVANLIENALKYARSRIDVGTGPGGVLWVEDDGPGIAPGDLPHVFEPFYRSTRAPGRHDVGSGLGLAIVKELAEAMDGTVRAHPAASGDAGGGGTRMVVTLPTPSAGRDAARQLER